MRKSPLSVLFHKPGVSEIKARSSETNSFRFSLHVYELIKLVGIFNVVLGLIR